MARFGENDEGYKRFISHVNYMVDNTNDGLKVFTWEAYNNFKDMVFTPYIESYGRDDRKRIAANLAWYIADKYGYPNKLKSSAREIAKGYICILGEYITDDDWARLTKKMGIKNNRKNKVNITDSEISARQSEIVAARARAVKFFQKIDDIHQPDASDYVDTDEYNMACITMKLTRDTCVRSMLDNISGSIDKSDDPKAKALLAAYGYNEAVARGLSKNNELDAGMVDLFVEVIKKHNYSTKDVDNLLKQFSEEDYRTKGVKVAIKQKLSTFTKNKATSIVSPKTAYTSNYNQRQLTF